MFSKTVALKNFNFENNMAPWPKGGGRQWWRLRLRHDDVCLKQKETFELVALIAQQLHLREFII